MGFQFVSVCLFFVGFAQIAGIAQAGLREDFYNSRISDTDFAARLKEKVGARKTDHLENAKKAIQLLLKTGESRYFSKRGEVGDFDFETPLIPGFKYGVQYYVPRSIGQKSNQLHPVLFFLHGGGASTATYASAKGVARSYLKDFINLAEDKKMILVFPSSSAGWNVQTRVMVREIMPLIREDLPCDPNRILISGHSMGAMGIVRETPFLVPQVSGLMPLAAGTPPSYALDYQLRTYFNTQYTHLNGKFDHFEEFNPRMRAVESRMESLSTQAGVPNTFRFMAGDYGHNYQLADVSAQLDQLLKQPRKLHQKKLFPTFYQLDFLGSNPVTAPKILPFTLNEYFWTEIDPLQKPEPGKQRFASYQVEVQANNRISILTDSIETKRGRKTADTPLMPKKFSIYLSSEMVDFTKPVQILIDGKLLHQERVTPSLETLVKNARKRRDHSFAFEGKVEVDLFKPVMKMISMAAER